MSLLDFTENPIFQGGKQILDGFGVNDALTTIANTDKSTPGNGLLHGFPVLDKITSGLGVATSTIDLIKARQNAEKYVENDDPVALVDAIHDGLTGTAGLVSLDTGQGGAVAKAASMGLAIGDMIAPHLFGTEKEDNQAKYVEDTGEFKPSTGNRYYDFMLDLYGITD